MGWLVRSDGGACSSILLKRLASDRSWYVAAKDCGHQHTRLTSHFFGLYSGSRRGLATTCGPRESCITLLHRERDDWPCVHKLHLAKLLHRMTSAGVIFFIM